MLVSPEAGYSTQSWLIIPSCKRNVSIMLYYQIPAHRRTLDVIVTSSNFSASDNFLHLQIRLLCHLHTFTCLLQKYSSIEFSRHWERRFPWSALQQFTTTLIGIWSIQLCSSTSEMVWQVLQVTVVSHQLNSCITWSYLGTLLQWSGVNQNVQVYSQTTCNSLW